jgi:hypothetical protein
MKIDVVYTWVDGSDQFWLNKKQKKAEQFGKILDNSESEALFMDNEELKYSLRSINMFAPWINNIFIVTDNQIPKWLNTAHPKINIIDHSEIFADKSNLPTFNSCVIENQLHHIKDLSEHFIYFNDDMFLGKKCTPDYFFTKNNLPRIFVSELITIPKKKLFDITKRDPSKINSYQHVMVNTRNIIKNKYGKSDYHNIRHSIKPFLKSSLQKLENELFEEIKKTNKNSFRTNDDILLTYAFEFYAAKIGIGKTKYLITADIKSGINKLLLNVYSKFSFGFINLHENNIEQHLERLKNAKPFTFCLNQTPETPKENLIKVKKFLEECYSDNSPFEK